MTNTLSGASSGGAPPRKRKKSAAGGNPNDNFANSETDPSDIQGELLKKNLQLMNYF